ncbi:MAG: hypothetical protein LBJ02_10100 [Bifidobacteriaceae bacterium]|jgi:hypothetical protein|nr:hypothetical protein [Bifidobacteriaceae bacterium]
MTAPPSHPRPLTNQEKAELDALQSKLNDGVYKSLSVWRTGFAAVLVLASGGLTISALDQMDKTAPIWRWLLAGLVVLGTVLGIVTLMIALRTEVGTTRGVVQRETIFKHGGALAFETGLADSAARRMHLSQRWGAASLVTLVTALAVLWLAPPSSQTPNLLVQHGASATCGKLLSADGGTVRLQVSGAHDPVAIAFGQISNMRIVQDCPAP